MEDVAELRAVALVELQAEIVTRGMNLQVPMGEDEVLEGQQHSTITGGIMTSTVVRKKTLRLGLKTIS